MRKIFFLLFFLLPMANTFAGLNFTSLFYQSSEQINPQFEPFAKYTGHFLNSGIAQSIFTNNSSIGAHFSLTQNNQEGVLKDVSEHYFMGGFFSGRFSIWNLRFLLRLGGSSLYQGPLLGAGIGYVFEDLIPYATLIPVVTFHTGINLANQISGNRSIGLHTIVRGNFGVLTPYVLVGFSQNNFQTEIPTNLYNTLDTFVYNTFLLHTAIGIRLKYFFYEITSFPCITHTFGITLEF